MTTESLIIIFVALAAGSLVKGISGLGLPLTAIPVMASFMDVDRAVAIMVIPGVFINLWLLWTYRESAVQIPRLPLVCCAGVLGVVLGALILSSVPGWYLLLAMAVWLGGYLLTLILKIKLTSAGPISKHMPLIVVSAAGIIQGAIGTAGPVLAPYVHSLKLKQPQYVFAVSVLFQIFAVTQLVSFIWLGLINMERAVESLMACIPIAIFLPLAVWLSRFFNDRGFNILIIGLLVVIEVRLIWRILV
jgi:uncharacterized membrane protein YfcA